MKFAEPRQVMERALQIARLGEGYVEPNPCVGAVLVDDDLNLISEGYHPRFGGPHAEVVALQLAGERTRGATLFVTLEPCSHFGKTPPCADAVIQAGVKKIWIGTEDPAEHVAGRGIEKLKAAGVQVEVGLCQEDALALIAPFQTLQLEKRPFVHAKWAMTLDGKLATRTGSSKWISNEQSRRLVHRLRARMDAILVGSGTAIADDPQLTPRPLGPRTPTRVVLDRRARIDLGSKLVSTAQEIPVMVFVSENANAAKVESLRAHGVEVIAVPDESSDVEFILNELGSRQMTNLLVEGGSEIHGAFWDAQLIDEVHCFIAPKVIGGAGAPSPIGGEGWPTIPQESQLVNPSISVLGQDVYVHGRIDRQRTTLK